jgi:hypothetical protein
MKTHRRRVHAVLSAIEANPVLKAQVEAESGVSLPQFPCMEVAPAGESQGYTIAKSIFKGILLGVLSVFISMFILMTSLFTTFAVCGFGEEEEGNHPNGKYDFICVYICMYVYIYIYLYIYSFLDVFIYTYILM